MTTILLSSCNQHDNPVTIPYDIRSIENSADKIVKTWVYASSNVFVHCILEIKGDSTFNYESGGCMGTCYTSGNWTFNRDHLILNSFDKYAPKKDSFVSKPNSTPDKLPENETAPGNTADTSGTSNFTISTVAIDPAAFSASLISYKTNFDSTTVYFKDKLFALDRDTLYEIQKIGQAGSKFYASKNHH